MAERAVAAYSVSNHAQVLKTAGDDGDTHVKVWDIRDFEEDDGIRDVFRWNKLFSPRVVMLVVGAAILAIVAVSSGQRNPTKVAARRVAGVVATQAAELAGSLQHSGDGVESSTEEPDTEK